MNAYELNEKATNLACSMSRYQLAKELVTLKEDLGQLQEQAKTLHQLGHELGLSPGTDVTTHIHDALDRRRDEAKAEVLAAVLVHDLKDSEIEDWIDRLRESAEASIWKRCDDTKEEPSE